MTSEPAPSPTSPFRAWLFLVGFSFRRQVKLRQMVGIAIGILLVSAFLVFLFSATTGWDRYEQRMTRSKPFLAEHVAGTMVHSVIDNSPMMKRIREESTPPAVFSRWVVFLLYLGFLLPLLSISFATGALGNERESRSLVWLMTRPMPRSAIYLAKFFGLLPWCIGLTVGGFGLLCLAGGEIGRQAFWWYFPGVLAGSVSFAALFHLFGALFSRPAVVGLLYAFFFETMLSELPIPGTLKRLSLNYYTRCLLYQAGEQHGVPTETASLFVPVSPTFAWVALIGATIALTGIGMFLFARNEYRDDV